MEPTSVARARPVRVAAVALLAPAILLAGCGKEAPPPPRPAPQVAVLTIAPKTIPFSPTFVAQTESSRQVNIVARVSGFLDRIAYQEGELVKQGQLMFVLDPKPFNAQLNAAQGELQSQQARLVTAEATFGRVKPLTEQDALPLSDLDKAKGELDAAKAAVYSARAKVSEAELNLGYATITSPVTGLASRALQRQGAFVNSMADSANLTYVAAIDPIWVNFSVSQNQAAKWKEMVVKGQIILNRRDSNEGKTGLLVAIDPADAPSPIKPTPSMMAIKLVILVITQIPISTQKAASKIPPASSRRYKTKKSIMDETTETTCRLKDSPG